MENAPGGQPSPTTESPALVSRSRQLGDVSVQPILEASSRRRLSWTAPTGPEIVGCGVAASLTATGPSRIDDVREQAETQFARLDYDGPTVGRPRAFGGFSFHDQRPVTETPNGSDRGDSPWEGFGPARFVIPRVQVVSAADETWLTAVGSDDAVSTELDRWQTRLESAPAVTSGESPTIESQERSTPTDAWRRQVHRAVETIESTELQKIVLAQSLTATLDGDLALPTILTRLQRRYPACYRFAIDGTDSSSFFGATPERLIAKDGTTFETEALAGSVPRGETPEAETSHAADLRRSEKLDAEHAFVVDAIRTNLTALVESITVRPQTIKRLATIQHLQTPMHGRIGANTHVLDIVRALHPTPAVGGVPQTQACETIRAIEPIDRGWYAAPIGWFDEHGDGEFAVGIRSGVIAGETVTLFAGNGIVAGSDADEEAAEIDLKFRSILDELH
ncbi:isochorismate synthase family protein [Halovivax ruber XH-70]|uniref:isochorismate synthase n=1 Tax=Halovivax ruber (strain DSM 18193 / JCM 13892 / XH-70) TaxID=797302 RepID=L0IDB3_HALRX|nr:isochorismate synthase [Halovivax ruber]AGB15952.1 isochorismate synthase family protein [Halovivax ruber XH-70]